MADMDDELDAAESKSEELTSELEQLEKTADENDQARKILENRGRNDTSKIEALEKELNEHNEKIADLDAKYEEFSQESK